MLSRSDVLDLHRGRWRALSLLPQLHAAEPVPAGTRCSRRPLPSASEAAPGRDHASSPSRASIVRGSSKLVQAGSTTCTGERTAGLPRGAGQITPAERPRNTNGAGVPPRAGARAPSGGRGCSLGGARVLPRVVARACLQRPGAPPTGASPLALASAREASAEKSPSPRRARSTPTVHSSAPGEHCA
jgi:hypothetical protein